MFLNIKVKFVGIMNIIWKVDKNVNIKILDVKINIFFWLCIY